MEMERTTMRVFGEHLTTARCDVETTRSRHQEVEDEDVGRGFVDEIGDLEASEASPTTKNPGSFSSSESRPWRTIGWSSPSTIPSSLVLLRDARMVQRQLHR
jgi:hypothetical protein